MSNLIDNRRQSENEELRYFPLCGCLYGPANSIGNYLWGGILVLAGGVWLLDTLELLPAVVLDALWPLLLIAVGVSILAWALYHRFQESS